jgi:AcrR family transcriptional regulator
MTHADDGKAFALIEQRVRVIFLCVTVSTAISGRDRILTTAERLIAEQGAAASLREIAAAAGQKNTSAVHYHFGSRDALIEAIVVLRQESLETERLALLAEHEAAGRTDLRALVEALITPMFTAPYADGATHYARFLEKVRDHASLSTSAWLDRDWPASKLIVGRISQALSALPAAQRLLRLRAMSTTMFALVADVERARDAGLSHLTAQDVTDLVLGMLTAPTHHDKD